MPRTILVVDHDPTWSAAFAKEAAALAVVFASQLHGIHHIGSTAIPGLEAKPVIDILIVVRDIATIDCFNPGMEGLGYRPRGECLDAAIPGTPGRFYFSKNNGAVRTHQAHVCQQGHPEIADKIAFREYLRAHPAEAAEYGTLKQHLAIEHRDDIVGYIQGKDSFVKTTLAEARRWRQAAHGNQWQINGVRLH